MSKNAKQSPPPVAEVAPSRCSKCGSTERTPYHGTLTTVRMIEGEHLGQPYTHVVWRRTKCTNCGQARVDKSYENRKKAKGK